MLAPLATIAFLTTLWLVARVLLDHADGSIAKIMAALRGQSVITQPSMSMQPVSVRFQPRAESVRHPTRVRPEWRAAA